MGGKGGKRGGGEGRGGRRASVAHVVGIGFVCRPFSSGDAAAASDGGESSFRMGMDRQLWDPRQGQGKGKLYWKWHHQVNGQRFGVERAGAA